MNIESKKIQDNAFYEVRVERSRQEELWKEQNHSPEYWLSILGKEFGEVCKAVCEKNYGIGTKGNYREELTHVAAIAIQMIECFDRKQIAIEKCINNMAFENDKKKYNEAK
jgi:hypothetical protein